MTRLLIAAVLLLGGCVGNIHKEAPVIRDGQELRLTVRLYPDVSSLDAAYMAQGGMATYREQAHGFAVLHGDRCELHLIRLRRETGKVMEDWGHELSHCVYGDWHG